MAAASPKNKNQQLGLGTLVLGFLVMFGLVLIIYRWFNGLGVTTGLSDGRGWGIWISFDVLCGIALAAGAFCIAGLVYILHLKEFYPILRPTVLTGFLGYALAAFAISVDLGFPHRIYYMLYNWNIHSPLFEVGWCVMIYATVLALEISPVVFERFNMKVPLKIIHFITIPLVILGIVLSTMHQSSLGTLFVLMPHRVHPLWYSGIMPVLFLVSAIAAGLSMVIVESTWSFFGLNHKLETRLLAKIAKIIPYVLGLYLLLKFIDIFISGESAYLFSEGKYSVFFWVEILINGLIPMILFSLPSVRKKPMQMFAAAIMVVFGLILNRFNVSLVAFDAGAYAPTWIELFVTIGMVAIGVFVFSITSRFFPVFSHEKQQHSQPVKRIPAGEMEPSFVNSALSSINKLEGKQQPEAPISRLE